jgi:hypothetical protein
VDTKERRIDNAIRFTEQHHKILSELLSNPETARIFDEKANAESVTQHEVHSVNLMLLHLDSAHQASTAGLYRLPEKLDADIREFFSLPIPKAVWPQLRPMHSKDFSDFVNSALKK